MDSVEQRERLRVPRNQYSKHMSGLRARVEKGRLVLDERRTLPEGRVVDLVADDEGDDLTDDERRALPRSAVGVLEIS